MKRTVTNTLVGMHVRTHARTNAWRIRRWRKRWLRVVIAMAGLRRRLVLHVQRDVHRMR